MKLSVRLRVFLSMCFLLLSGYIFMGHTRAASRPCTAVPAFQKQVSLPKVNLPDNRTVSVRTLPYVDEKETQQIDETDGEDDEDDEPFSLRRYTTAVTTAIVFPPHFKQIARHSNPRQAYTYARHFSFYNSGRIIAFRSIRI